MNWIIGIILLMAFVSDAAALDARAGNDQHVSPSTVVELDGSGSTGTGTLTYNWTEGDTVLSDQVSFSRKFSIGTHIIELTVSNGINTDTDTVVVRVNQPPIADAGEDRVILPDTYIKLDASGSRDLDGSIASYKWTEDEVELSTRKSFNKIFGYGVHRITLTVTDDFGDQDTDCMMVMVLLRGDLNRDGVITPADAAIALQLAACDECASGASADPRSTSPAAGITSASMAQASALGMSVADAACIIKLDARYGDAEAQEVVVTLTLTNTGGQSIVEQVPTLLSPESGITLTALGNYPIIVPGNESVDVRIKVHVAGDVAEGAYHATAHFGDSAATITINVQRLTRYNLDCEIADVSGDGRVTSLDALMILQMAAVD
ncbi:MAG: Dockerin type I repeat-containing protein [Candidatus Methanomarinus sp.]|nr:MAG: Dockerin type I repeat-containing protein [ANME-2 cluster archaeon]